MKKEISRFRINQRKRLKEWHEKSGLPLKGFFNTSGMLYKEQKLKERLPQMTEEERYEVLASGRHADKNADSCDTGYGS